MYLLNILPIYIVYNLLFNIKYNDLMIYDNIPIYKIFMKCFYLHYNIHNHSSLIKTNFFHFLEISTKNRTNQF